MAIASAKANVAPPPATATSRDARDEVDVPTLSAPRWPQPQPSPVTLWIFAICNIACDGENNIMEPFTTLTGMVMPLDRTNVNTDEITPARFLKTIRRTGFARALFANWRYIGGDESKPDPDFVLNQPRYQGASILLAGDNFGCGSSREHAPWAIGEYGFRCIIAPSFADIFYNNCFNNSILPATLDQAIVDELFAEVEVTEGYTLA